MCLDGGEVRSVMGLVCSRFHELTKQTNKQTNKLWEAETTPAPVLALTLPTYESGKNLVNLFSHQENEGESFYALARRRCTSMRRKHEWTFVTLHASSQAALREACVASRNPQMVIMMDNTRCHVL